LLSFDGFYEASILQILVTRSDCFPYGGTRYALVVTPRPVYAHSFFRRILVRFGRKMVDFEKFLFETHSSGTEVTFSEKLRKKIFWS